MLARKVYNNDAITFFSVYQRLQSPRVIMFCSPHRFPSRAATHDHTRAWQTLIRGKECFILLMFYLKGVGPFTYLQKTKHLSCHLSSGAGKIDVLRSASIRGRAAGRL